MKLLKTLSLPARFTIAISMTFVVIFTAMFIMFYRAGNVMEREAIRHIEYNTLSISQSIDEIVQNVYSVSDAFAFDSRLQEYTDAYVPDNPREKLSITLQISKRLFSSYDMLRNNEKMAAFYNTKNDEVFNFLNPNFNDMSCLLILKAMNINSPDKLAKFHWYPVKNNFLKQNFSGDIRRDKAAIGTRRVFSKFENSYVGVHIFAINEETIYRKYSDILEQYSPASNVFIITEDGDLLSSSDINTLRDGFIDPRFQELILNRQHDRFSYNGKIVCVRESGVNDWLTVMCVPETYLSGVVDNLFNMILIMLILFAVAACVLIFILYKNFMHPVSMLITSMRRVHDGDLNAYADVVGNNEISAMIGYYNAMLESINHNIEERLNTEKHKKQLEMDVLMNQINPHFLYNTLETIVWKSSEAGRPDIGRIAAALGRIYRLSISGGKLFVSLSQELEHVDSFIKVQHSRYEDNFVFEIIADRAAMHELYTIKMLLQPLVENSLSHGMEQLKRTLYIRLSVRVLTDCVQVRITDTGIGMDAVKLGKVRRQALTGAREISQNPMSRKSTGLGMHNVYERLKVYFGESADLSIWSKKNIGTVITLHLPKISADEAKRLNTEKM